MTTIFLETHATTTDNEAGTATGWAPGRLSAVGELQARAMGMRYPHLDAVHASDLTRAARTAELAFSDSGTPVHHDRRLRECDYGDLTGAARAHVDAVRTDHVSTPFPGGQSYQDVVDGLRGLLVEVVAARPGGHVLLIGHFATRCAVEHLLGGVELHRAVADPGPWQPGWRYSADLDVLRCSSTSRRQR